MDNEKVLDTSTWVEDGEYGDIIKCLHKVADIICMAAEVTDEGAKKTLFTSAEILLRNCELAIGKRTNIDIEDDD